MLLKADCYSFIKPSGKDDYLNVMAMSYVCLMQLTKQLGTLYHLFFLVVKTNVDYQVVGSFIVQDETSSAIMEALNVISTWSTEWKPGYFMVDNSNEEINAINSLFPGNCKQLHGTQTKLVYLMLKLSFKFSILIVHCSAIIGRGFESVWNLK